jgi:transposase
MTNATQPNPVPALLVYGTPSSPALTQASWFRAEDKEVVKAAAEALKFSVIELHTDGDRAIAAGAHEGVLKGSGGRLIVGSVSAEVYRRIEEHVRKAAGPSERFFNMLKHFRAIATRYDKLAKTFLAGVQLACAAILLN